jgi:VWFA-related protein
MKRSSTRLARLAIFLVISAILAPGAPARAQDQERPTFSASVAVVPITALVRDSKNRIVRGLERADFQVLEQGQPRPIVDFKSREDAPVSVAFLFDTSGSMRVASNLEKGLWFIDQFLANMAPASDEAALFTFHKTLRQEVEFTGDRERIRRALGQVNPWGLTSLYDAVAETAKQVAHRPAPRRALVVISDGVDTSSSLTPQEVSALASSIDVPVYVVAVVSPLDRPDRAGNDAAAQVSGNLADLANWTGGELLYVSVPDQTSAATRELIATMRQQYFLAIESASAPGWYALEVKTRRRGLFVKSRRGYFADTVASGAAKDDR